ncbi:MAG: DUF1566 domain-containing protein [Bacteroidaceae bacterium]|nr:DUF1566 domain-containing protein [Bacteroidaceae bacterium]
MKKFLLSLSLFAMTLMASSQEPTLKARSIYDVNQDDKVTVQDVPALANKLLGKADDKTAVDTQSLLDVLKELKEQYLNVLSKLNELQREHKALMWKFDIADPNCVFDGTFSVSSTKKVQFTKGNLWWDGSAYHFEANQTDYPTSWNPNHIGHFFWTSSKDYQSGNANYMPYALGYSYSSQSTSDKFFCGEENPLTVDGTSGCFALSNDEWGYLIYTRANASSLRKYGVTVSGKVNCLIIAPDGFSSTLKSSYTLDEVNSLGLVCLPAAGERIGSSFGGAESWGYCWSSTPYSSYSGNACCLYFGSGNVYTGSSNYRYGRSLRLVRLPQ